MKKEEEEVELELVVVAEAEARVLDSAQEKVEEGLVQGLAQEMETVEVAGACMKLGCNNSPANTRNTRSRIDCLTYHPST